MQTSSSRKASTSAASKMSVRFGSLIPSLRNPCPTVTTVTIVDKRALRAACNLSSVPDVYVAERYVPRLTRAGALGANGDRVRTEGARAGSRKDRKGEDAAIARSSLRP